MADDKKDDLLPRYREEARAYEFPWYRRLGHELTDWWYGPDANAQQGAKVQHLVGPENPFNIPGQISEGVDRFNEGYRRGDVGQMGHGAVEAGFAMLPPALGASRLTGRIAEGALAKREAAHAAEAAKGPWGNPKMIDEVANRPQPPRHELNEPAAQKQGPQRAYKGDFERLGRQRQDLINEALRFQRPQPERQGRWWYPPEKEVGQNWKDVASNADLAPGAAAKDVRRMGANNENIPGAVDEAEEIARRLEALNPEHQKYYKLWRQEHANWFEKQPRTNRRGREIIDKETGIPWRYGRDSQKFNEPRVDRESIAARAEEEANDWRPGGSGTDWYMDMESSDLKRILMDEYGADPMSRASLEDAYKRFWADERAKRAAGKPTIHGEEAQRVKWENDNYVRTHLGLDPEKISDAERQAAMDAHFDNMRLGVRKSRENANDRMAGRGERHQDEEAQRAARSRHEADLNRRRARGEKPTFYDLPWMTDEELGEFLKGKVGKGITYGGSGAAAGYTGYKLGEMGRDSAQQKWEEAGRDEGLTQMKIRRQTPDLKYPPPTPFDEPKAESPLPVSPKQQGSLDDQVTQEIAAARRSRITNNAIAGIHGVGGVMAAFAPGWINKAIGMGTMGLNGALSLRDAAEAEEKRKLWKAIQRDYVQKRGSLDEGPVE